VRRLVRLGQWDIRPQLGASLLRSNFEGRRAEDPNPTDRSPGRATLLLDMCSQRVAHPMPLLELLPCLKRRKTL